MVGIVFAWSKDKEDAVKVRIQLTTDNAQSLLSFFIESMLTIIYLVYDCTFLVVLYVHYTLYVSMYHLSTRFNNNL